MKVIRFMVTLIAILTVVLIASVSMVSAFTIDGEEFSSMKVISIDNTGNPDTLSEYQIKIEVPYEPGMQSDFDDLRFTDSSDAILDYWVEEFTSEARATVWVEIPSIPGGGTTTIKMFYNNPSASSRSDGEATFVFFDDFEGADYDTTKWTITRSTGSYSVANSILTVNSGTGGASGERFTSNDIFSVDTALRMRVTMDDLGSGSTENYVWVGYTEGSSPDVNYAFYTSSRRYTVLLLS